ncbi:MAG TPA: acyl carrier protein [Bacillota bacterium]|jgi:acyl carrier protein|nr:acyl carrier protein [Bacillota bacterium]HPZ59156.1 acyl carrier protein [Bacillota bacterium]HQC82498.1 acyl carrier protein [Bacillota bacterium]
MTFEKIAELIAENKDMDLSNITMETSFDDMELDSLDVIEVVMAIEEAFGITLEIDENIKTVGDLVDLVDSLIEN